MNQSLPFHKLHGLGNDFILLDQDQIPFEVKPLLTPGVVSQLCHRRFGIGADQLFLVSKAQDAKCEARMEIWNTDGSQAEMCGNGIRAVALYLWKRANHQKKTRYPIELVSGVKTVLVRETATGLRFSVNMGKVQVSPSEILKWRDITQEYYSVNVGNPHAVVFLPVVAPNEKSPPVKGLDSIPLEHWGPEIENHSRFAPHRTNVEFVEVKTSSKIRVRVWERGAGATLACGSGACAAAAAALFAGRLKEKPIQVELPGGELQVSWDPQTQETILEGPAEWVYSGVYSGWERFR